MTLYQVLTVAETNDHKFSDLKQYNFIICISGGEKYGMGLMGLKSRSHQGCVPFRNSGRELFLLPFPASRDCLHSFNGGSSIFKANDGQSSLSHAHHSDFVSLTISPSLTLKLLLPSFTYKHTCDYIRLAWIIQDYLPSSRSLI